MEAVISGPWAQTCPGLTEARKEQVLRRHAVKGADFSRKLWGHSARPLHRRASLLCCVARIPSTLGEVSGGGGVASQELGAGRVSFVPLSPGQTVTGPRGKQDPQSQGGRDGAISGQGSPMREVLPFLPLSTWGRGGVRGELSIYSEVTKFNTCTNNACSPPTAGEPQAQEHRPSVCWGAHHPAEPWPAGSVRRNNVRQSLQLPAGPGSWPSRCIWEKAPTLPRWTLGPTAWGLSLGVAGSSLAATFTRPAPWAPPWVNQ